MILISYQVMFQKFLTFLSSPTCLSFFWCLTLLHEQYVDTRDLSPTSEPISSSSSTAFWLKPSMCLFQSRYLLFSVIYFQHFKLKFTEGYIYVNNHILNIIGSFFVFVKKKQFNFNLSLF